MKHPFLLLMVSLICHTNWAQDSTSTRFKDINQDELALINRLSQQGMSQSRSRTLSAETGAVILTEVKTLTEPEAGKGPQKTAMAYYYKYTGDVGVVSYIDLDNQQLIRIEERPHMAVPFSLEEIERAKSLARANPTVAAKIAVDTANTVLETLPTTIGNREDPMYHHRITRILIRRGQSYVSKPVVYVDLTTGTVYLR